MFYDPHGKLSKVYEEFDMVLEELNVQERRSVNIVVNSTMINGVTSAREGNARNVTKTVVKTK